MYKFLNLPFSMINKPKYVIVILKDIKYNLILHYYTLYTYFMYKKI